MRPRIYGVRQSVAYSMWAWQGGALRVLRRGFALHFNMTLHAGLANRTRLQSFMVWDCSICELGCLNSNKEKEKPM